MKNELILAVKNHWCHRRASRILYNKPLFGAKRKAQWEKERDEFWYVMERMNPEFMQNCPDGYRIMLTSIPSPRNAPQMFYIHYAKKEQK